MEMTVRLRAGATPAAAALLLRPWEPSDAGELAELYQDGALRRWTSASVDDADGAAGWIREQRDGWRAGHRFALAVAEDRMSGGAGGAGGSGGGGRLVGHVVLKRSVLDPSSAEVGYWTAAHARGRGVASRALRALTDWAFTAFADDGLGRLELLHQVDNEASCRVAQKCGYELSALLPPAPPDFPYDGHLHARLRGA